MSNDKISYAIDLAFTGKEALTAMRNAVNDAAAHLKTRLGGAADHVSKQTSIMGKGFLDVGKGLGFSGPIGDLQDLASGVGQVAGGLAGLGPVGVAALGAAGVAGLALGAGAALAAAGVGMVALVASSGALDKATQPFRKEGLGISKRDSEQLESARAALSAVGTVAADLALQFAVAVGPAVEQGARLAVAFGMKLGDAVRAGVDGMSSLTRTVVGVALEFNPLLAQVRLVLAGFEGLAFAGEKVARATGATAVADGMKAAGEAAVSARTKLSGFVDKLADMGAANVQYGYGKLVEYAGEYMTKADAVIARQKQVTAAVKETADAAHAYSGLAEILAARKLVADTFTEYTQKALSGAEAVRAKYAAQLNLLQESLYAGVSLNEVTTARRAVLAAQNKELAELAAKSDKLWETNRLTAEEADKIRESLNGIVLEGTATALGGMLETVTSMATGWNTLAESLVQTETKSMRYYRGIAREERNRIKEGAAAQAALTKATGLRFSAETDLSTKVARTAKELRQEDMKDARKRAKELWQIQRAGSIAATWAAGAVAAMQAYAQLGPVAGTIAAAGIVASALGSSIAQIKENAPKFHAGSNALGPLPSYSGGPDEFSATILRGEKVVSAGDARSGAGSGGGFPTVLELVLALPGAALDRAMYDIIVDPGSLTARAIARNGGRVKR